jgi:hypothetical protein
MLIKYLKLVLVIATVFTFAYLLSQSNKQPIGAFQAQAAQLACVDSDNGDNPYVAGNVTISEPALPEVANDSCLTLDVQTIDNVTYTKWIKGNTGTHVSEFSCINTSTGEFMDKVHYCANGCNMGACNPELPATVNKSVNKGEKIEGKGTILAVNKSVLVINSISFNITPNTNIKYNDRIKEIGVGQSSEFKGYLNLDGSVTLTKIEVRN